MEAWGTSDFYEFWLFLLYKNKFIHDENLRQEGALFPCNAYTTGHS